MTEIPPRAAAPAEQVGTEFAVMFMAGYTAVDGAGVEGLDQPHSVPEQGATPQAPGELTASNDPANDGFQPTVEQGEIERTSLTDRFDPLLLNAFVQAKTPESRFGITLAILTDLAYRKAESHATGQPVPPRGVAIQEEARARFDRLSAERIARAETWAAVINARLAAEAAARQTDRNGEDDTDDGTDGAEGHVRAKKPAVVPPNVKRKHLSLAA